MSDFKHVEEQIAESSSRCFKAHISFSKCSECRMRDTMQALLDAAEAGNRLQNEVHGSLQYLDRSVCGNTNYVCLQTAAIATREAIAKLQEQNDD